MVVNGFEECSRDDMVSAWADTVRTMHESGIECMRREFASVGESEKARVAINSAAKRLGLPIKAHRRGSTCYVERVEK